MNTTRDQQFQMAILNAPTRPQVDAFWKTLAIVFGIGVVALTVLLFVLLSLWPEPRVRVDFPSRRIAVGGEGCGTDACMDATTGAAGSGVLAAPYFSRPCPAPASGVHLTTEQHRAAGMPSLADIQRRGFLNLKQTQHQS